MKKIILYIFIFLFSSTLSGQKVPDNDRATINGYINKMMYLDLKPVVSDALPAVFAGKFYIVHQEFKFDTSGTWICQNIKLNVNGSNVSYLEGLNSNMVVNSLPVMLKKDFLLKDENAAAKFESALNVIYPFEDSDKGQIKHMKKGNQWIFIRGKFFDNYNAMIITVDPKGAITKITYNLGYKM
jgi:hypothetical protein